MTYNVQIKALDGKVVEDMTGLERMDALVTARGYGVEHAQMLMDKVDALRYAQVQGANCAVYVERTHF